MNDITEVKDHLVISATNSSGGKYAIGYPTADGYSRDTLVDELQTAQATPAGYQALNWVPGQQPGYTSPGAERIGIQQGYVSHDRGPIYAYRINFYNTKGWHFDFSDESGDVYRITTIRNGWHYIDYNSEQPIIIGVR